MMQLSRVFTRAWCFGSVDKAQRKANLCGLFFQGIFAGLDVWGGGGGRDRDGGGDGDI